MVTVKCKLCGNQFQAREADRKRGWGRFCSKSCAASHKARKPNSQYKQYLKMKREQENIGLLSEEDFHSPSFSNAHHFSNDHHFSNED